MEGPARIRWDLETELGIRDYHEDYEGTPGVDRLDYTKGIPERLRTFRRLLRSAPKWRRLR